MFVLVLTLALTVPCTARAGGALVYDTAGNPVGWSTTTAVPYHLDSGALGTLRADEAVSIVQRLVATWENVPTARITFEHAGSLLDVNQYNFGAYLGPFGGRPTPANRNAIVFDANGAIFDQLFGVGTGIVGFASPTFLSDGEEIISFGGPVPPGSHIIEGMVFLNGKAIDGVDDPWFGNFEVGIDEFEAAIVHELGHFCGLHHTQIHGLRDAPSSDNRDPTQPVETMFPRLVDRYQASLERDDVVSLSVLYPTAAFTASTGTISGTTRHSDGHPISGLNVIARNVSEHADAVSYVSGANGTSAGAFWLAGLTPGASYRVEIQEIDVFHRGGSAVGNFATPAILPGPPEYYSGARESDDPDFDLPSESTPIVPAAGQTTRAIDIVLNRQSFDVSNDAFVGRNLISVAVGDFDADGLTDFVATENPGFDPRNATLFYRGMGSAGFAAPRRIQTFPGNMYVVAGHFNPLQDAHLDIAVGSLVLAEARVYLGNGRGEFAAPQAVVTRPSDGLSHRLMGLATGNLNGDAYADLFALVDNNRGGAQALSLLADGTGGFETVTTTFPPDTQFPRYLFGSVKVANFAADPADDVIGFRDGTSLSLLVNDGAGRFQSQLVPLDAITWRTNGRLGVGDLDANGTQDLVIANLSPVGGPSNRTRSFVDILLGDGAGGFTRSVRYEVPETSQESFVLEDFDADGKLDVASTGAFIGRGAPGANVQIAFGDGAGGVKRVNSIWGLSEFPHRMASGDFDADGRLDLLVTDTSMFGASFALAGSVLLNRMDGVPTSQGFADLSARALAEGVEISWRWDVDDDVEANAVREVQVYVQRAVGPEGPYANRNLKPLTPSVEMRFMDTHVEAGAMYWYRVVALRASGVVRRSHALVFRMPRADAAAALEIAAARDGGCVVEIRYRVAGQAAFVKLDIFDVRGRRVRSLLQSTQQAGAYVERWRLDDQRGARVARGVYLVRLAVGRQTQTARAVVLRP